MKRHLRALSVDEFITSSLPMCRYPHYPHYRGIQRAESYECRKP